MFDLTPKTAARLLADFPYHGPDETRAHKALNTYARDPRGITRDAALEALEALPENTQRELKQIARQ